MPRKDNKKDSWWRSILQDSAEVMCSSRDISPMASRGRPCSHNQGTGSSPLHWARRRWEELDRHRPIWSAPKQPSEGGAGWACPAAWNAVLTIRVMRGTKSHNTKDGRDNKAVVYKVKRPSLPPPPPIRSMGSCLDCRGSSRSRSESTSSSKLNILSPVITQGL